MKDPRCHRYEPSTSRRDFLFHSGVGLGAIALQSLPGKSAQAASPLIAKQAQLRPRAKNVIFLYMEGGPSHLDLFDSKPLLN